MCESVYFFLERVRVREGIQEEGGDRESKRVGLNTKDIHIDYGAL